MTESSLRPIRRLSTSSFPSFVSKRQPAFSFTMGIGKIHSSLPTTSSAISSPDFISLFASPYDFRKRSRSALSAAASPELTIPFASGPRMASTAFWSPAAATRAFTASSGEANVFPFVSAAVAGPLAANKPAAHSAPTVCILLSRMPIVRLLRPGMLGFWAIRHALPAPAAAPAATAASPATEASPSAREPPAGGAAVTEVARLAPASRAVESTPAAALHGTAIRRAAAISRAAEVSAAGPKVTAPAISHAAALELVGPATRDVALPGFGTTAKLLARVHARALSPSELVPASLVAILHAPAMLRVVLPIAAVAGLDVGPVEVVVLAVVDIDVTPAPVAVAPVGANRDSQSEGKEGSARDITRRVVVIRRIRRIRPRAVHDRRVVRRDVDYLRIRRLDLDDRRAALLLGGDVLLLARLEVAGRLCLRSQPLYRIQHVLLLREKGVAQLRGHIELLVQHLESLWERRERLHTRVPLLLFQRVLQRLVLQVGIRLRPACSLDDLQRIGRCHQHLSYQRVGIERDGRDELFELLRLELGRRPDSRRARGLRAVLREAQRQQQQSRDQPRRYSFPQAIHGAPPPYILPACGSASHPSPSAVPATSARPAVRRPLRPRRRSPRPARPR